MNGIRDTVSIHHTADAGRAGVVRRAVRAAVVQTMKESACLPCGTRSHGTNPCLQRLRMHALRKYALHEIDGGRGQSDGWPEPLFSLSGAELVPVAKHGVNHSSLKRKEGVACNTLVGAPHLLSAARPPPRTGRARASLRCARRGPPACPRDWRVRPVHSFVER